MKETKVNSRNHVIYNNHRIENQFLHGLKDTIYAFIFKKISMLLLDYESYKQSLGQRGQVQKANVRFD